MKIIDYLNQLPDGYRERALANTFTTNETAASIPDAIKMAFTWANTPEGHEFWSDVWIHYRHGDPLPFLPVDETFTKIKKEDLTRLPNGQYVIIWDIGGNHWSDTIKVINGKVKVYNFDSDGFEDGSSYSNSEFMVYPPVKLKPNYVPQEKLDALNILYPNSVLVKEGKAAWVQTVNGWKMRVPSLDKYDFEEIKIG